MVNQPSDRMMSTNVDKLVDDAKKMACRLRDRIVLGGLTNFVNECVKGNIDFLCFIFVIADSLVSQSEAISENLVTLKLLQNEFDALNKLARKTTNQQLVKTINNEYPHIREIQMENRELRACLNDRK